MNRILTLLLLVSTLPAFANQNVSFPGAQKKVKIEVAYSFLSIEEGYDHECKTELYVDGKLVATSKTHKQSEPASVSAIVSKGSHEIRVVNYALYEGNWEAHTIDNNYSIDCKWSETIDLKKKKNVITLVFNLDSGTSRIN